VVRLTISQAKSGAEFLLGSKSPGVLACPTPPEPACGKFVRNPHIKWQTALQLDFAVEQMNRFGGAQAKIRKELVNLAFEAEFNASSSVAVLLIEHGCSPLVATGPSICGSNFFHCSFK
jgi:hypothetical protein